MKVVQHFYECVVTPTIMELEQVLRMFQGGRGTVVRFTCCPQTDCSVLSHKVLNHLPVLALKEFGSMLGFEHMLSVSTEERTVLIALEARVALKSLMHQIATQ